VSEGAFVFCFTQCPAFMRAGHVCFLQVYVSSKVTLINDGNVINVYPKMLCFVLLDSSCKIKLCFIYTSVAFVSINIRRKLND